MIWPLLAGVTAARLGRGAWVVDRARELSSFDDGMEDNLVVHRVQRVDGAFRIREVLRVPGELPISSIPAGRRELGAEVDQSVAG